MLANRPVWTLRRGRSVCVLEPVAGDLPAVGDRHRNVVAVLAFQLRVEVDVDLFHLVAALFETGFHPLAEPAAGAGVECYLRGHSLHPATPVIHQFQQLLRRGVGYLFPGEAERDPGFRAEIERLSVRALWAIGYINLVMPMVGFLFHSIVQVFEPDQPRPLWSLVAFPSIGLLVLATARWSWGRRRARVLALLWGFVSGSLLSWSQFSPVTQPDTAHVSSAINIVVVLLVGVVAVPARPWQILLLAASLNASNFALSSLAVAWDLIPPISLHHYAGLDLIALLCTGLAALNYHRIHETYRAHRSEMAAQSRLLVADNAASLGKFAATISHQLNSPLGALSSSLDSLHRLSTRHAPDDPRLRELEQELFINARDSADRIEDAVRRMQRFTNLDRAEAHPVDLAQLLRDVAVMVEPDAERNVRIEVSSEALPKLTLRPQQMSAVFAKLLQNAVRASRPGSQVGIQAACRNGSVEVRISDHGSGVDPAVAKTLFEPGFQVRDGKVVGAHWGLFTARQVVREYGGDIDVKTEPGRGVEVLVTLPTTSPNGAAEEPPT